MATANPKLELTKEASEFIDEWLAPSHCIMAHTSGSTGQPKPINLLKSDMLISARATLSFFGLGSVSTLLLPLSQTYIAGKMQIVRALEGDCHLIAEPPSNHPFHSLEKERVSSSSMIAIVPSQIEGLMASPVFSRISVILIGGAQIPTRLESKLVEAGANAWASYGMTETCSHVALRKLGGELYHPVKGFSFSTDSRGCLVISSSAMSFGTLTTNDMVELTPSGSFKFLGRYDNVINSGGYKIHPEQVERMLQSALPPGLKAYVTSRPSDRWGEEAVVVTDWNGLTMSHLSAIPSIMRPKEILVREKIQLTSSGKIIREKLR